MVCRALLAARSPPRLSRCLSVRPLLAGSGRTPAQVRERRFASQPVGIVPGRDQQLRCDFYADAVEGEQRRCGRGDQREQIGVDIADLVAQLLVATGQAPQGGFGGSWDRIGQCGEGGAGGRLP